MTAAKRKALGELLESDMVIRREHLGLQPQLAPFPQHCSCQRLMMMSSHVVQSMVLKHAEPPRIFTGMENVIGKYMFTTTRREQDAHILAIVPKFAPTRWHHGDDMPSYTVLYRGEKDGLVHYMEVNKYTFLHDGFGYINERPDIDMLAPESDLPKEACLTRSPAWKGNDYCMGLNANVCFLTDWSVTEDAFVISESFAKKCTNLSVNQIKLNLGIDDVMLNLYGDHDVDEYKVIPDIGDTVRSDGIIAAIRQRNSSSCVTDMSPEALQKIEPLHDELHKAPPGSKILDVDVYINFDQLRKMKDSDTCYDQLLKFYKDHMYYYDEIVKYYQEFLDQGMQISDEFNTLVLRCMELSNNKKFVKKHIKLCDPREPIEFITVVITYSFEREISLGSKLTGREGGKGVISEIRPDDMMPVDDNGIRADIVMTPASIINRMNPSQLYEQFWNRVSDQVVRNVVAEKMGWKQAYQYMLGFCRDFRKNYAEALDVYLLDTDDKKKAWVEENIQIGYIRLLAAWTKHHTLRDIKGTVSAKMYKDIVDECGGNEDSPYGYLNFIARKYGVEATPVTYKFKDEDTGEIVTVRTKQPALIGSKYLMYLGKIPDDVITSVEVGHVNQFETPIKPKSKRVKEQSLVGLTPQKFGEDEVCMLNMSLGCDVVARMMCLHSAAPSISKELFKTLLTEGRPTQLTALNKTTQEVINENRNVLIFADMMGAIGYDVRPPNVVNK